MPFNAEHRSSLAFVQRKHTQLQRRLLSIASHSSSSHSVTRKPILLPSASLSYQWDTLQPPQRSQLHHADKLFTSSPPRFLWSAPKFARMSFGHSPEVCFLGRSNVGKSSLLNALLNRRTLAHVSSRAGRTVTMNAFGVGGPVVDRETGAESDRLVVLDMPGYGRAGRAEWGKEIMKYLVQRKELKMAFLLVDAEHGIKESDTQILEMLRRDEVPHQVVLSKIDKVLIPRSKTPTQLALDNRLAQLRLSMKQMRKVVQPRDVNHAEDGEEPAKSEIIACSAERIINDKRLGIDVLRHAILSATDLALPRDVPQVEHMAAASASDIVSFEELGLS